MSSRKQTDAVTIEHTGAAGGVPSPFVLDNSSPVADLATATTDPRWWHPFPERDGSTATVGTSRARIRAARGRRSRQWWPEGGGYRDGGGLRAVAAPRGRRL
uniref:Uncharacterized protein n=1 Tax=Oryza meridionalis TaxID=40149 RepID=A0A0E0DD75_9ORYZ